MKLRTILKLERKEQAKTLSDIEAYTGGHYKKISRIELGQQTLHDMGLLKKWCECLNLDYKKMHRLSRKERGLEEKS